MPLLSADIFVIYFSPYSAHMVEYCGVTYPTVEHAYHCQRYADSAIRQEIQSARSPFHAWEISQRYKSQQVPDFPERKRDVMKELCRLKTFQHADVRQALVESGDVVIVKHITTGPSSDGFWDDGKDSAGRNDLGKIWMELREELKPNT